MDVEVYSHSFEVYSHHMPLVFRYQVSFLSRNCVNVVRFRVDSNVDNIFLLTTLANNTVNKFHPHDSGYYS